MDKKLIRGILLVIDNKKESEINSRTIKVFRYSDTSVAECVEDLVDWGYVISRNVTTHSSDLVDGKWFKEFMISRITGKARKYLTETSPIQNIKNHFIFLVNNIWIPVLVAVVVSIIIYLLKI